MDLMALHNKAMELCGEADRARLTRPDEAKRLFLAAFELEKQVALGVEAQPSRSVLLKSAASIAKDAALFRDAELLIGLALSEGETPDLIRLELKEILDDLDYERHLHLDSLANDGLEVEVSLVGPKIGHGQAPSDLVTGRIEAFNFLLQRMTEFKMDVPYRTAGAAPKDVTSRSRVYLGTARAASYAFTMLVHDSQQSDMFLPPQIILQDIFSNIQLLENFDKRELKTYFTETHKHAASSALAYYKSFCSLAAQLFPDGREVTAVGMGWNQGRTAQSLYLKTTNDELRGKKSKSDPDERDEDVVIGVLEMADRKSGKARISREGQEDIKLFVSEGLDDVVRQYWGSMVKASLRIKGGDIFLDEVELLTEA